MQPFPPDAPNRPARVPQRSSFGSGMVFGVLALLAIFYVMDHAGRGEAAVFSGVDRRVSTLDFRNAQCTAIFGACKIDLRDAQIQGSEAVLDTFTIFGGVEVLVPENWEVVNHGVTIFGGTDDHTRRPFRGPDTKTLILQGATIFGGTSVKN